jgi:hypothetical protein
MDSDALAQFLTVDDVTDSDAEFGSAAASNAA